MKSWLKFKKNELTAGWVWPVWWPPQQHHIPYPASWKLYGPVRTKRISQITEHRSFNNWLFCSYSPYLEAVGKQFQLRKQFSVRVQVLQSLQTFETHLSLLKWYNILVNTQSLGLSATEQPVWNSPYHVASNPHTSGNCRWERHRCTSSSKHRSPRYRWLWSRQLHPYEVRTLQSAIPFWEKEISSNLENVTMLMSDL